MRPKTIKYGSGQITFKNFPIEEREEVISRIKGPKMVPFWDEEKEEYSLVPEIEIKEEVVEVLKELPQKGLSFVKVGGSWSAVELAFDAETKEARVTNITSLHTNVNIAREKFRIKFAKEFL